MSILSRLNHFRVLLGLFLLSASAVAAPIDTIFRESFFDSRIYVENRCGQNIERFLLRLESAGVDLAPLEVIEIVNPGIENFGLVAAYSARVGYRTNWGHHVVLYDGKQIYDFDFTRSPDPRRPSIYFSEMFKDAEMRASSARCLKYIGAYELRVHFARDYLDAMAKRGRLKYRTARLRDVPDWGCGKPRQMRRVGL